MRGPLAALVAACGLGACGGPEPSYSWREGAVATFEVRVREELRPSKIAREVQISATGRVAGASALELSVVRVRHELLGASGALTAVDTSDTTADPADRTAGDAALARVAEALTGRSVRLTFDPVRGLAAVSGMDAALDAAARASDPDAEEARDGLRSLVSDAALLRSLRAAGLCAAPDSFRDRSASYAREAEAFVPGRGVTPLRLTGAAGEEKDGSPVLRLAGTLRDDASFSGDPGPAPMDEIGAVVVRAVKSESETLYDRDTRTPLRGRAEIAFPFERFVTMAVRTSFTMAVRP